jgi:hypothetical protein
VAIVVHISQYSSRVVSAITKNLVVFIHVAGNHYSRFLCPFHDAACSEIRCVVYSDMHGVDDSDGDRPEVFSQRNAIQLFIYASSRQVTKSLTSHEIVPVELLHQI